MPPSARAFLAAVAAPDPKAAERLLDEGLSPDARVDGGRLVHHAAAGPSLAILRLLLLRGATVDALDGDLQTPLCWAVRAGRAEQAKLLLRRGADPTVPLLDWTGPRIARSLLEHAQGQPKLRGLAALLKAVPARRRRRPVRA